MFVKGKGEDKGVINGKRKEGRKGGRKVPEGALVLLWY